MEHDTSESTIYDTIEELGDDPLYVYFDDSTHYTDKGKPLLTLLHMAVHYNLIVSFERITKQGISINARDKYGSTALHWATCKGNLNAMKELIRLDADLNSKGFLGETALHIAAQSKNNEILQLLLEYKADPNIHEHDFNLTPLHRVAIHDNVEAIELLVQHNTLVGAVDKEGLTALHIAAFNKHRPVMDTLLKAGADINATTHDKSIPDVIGLPEDFNADGRWTALHTVASQGHVELIEGLINARADTTLEDQISRTPLHIAAQYGSICAVRSLFTLDPERQEAIINNPDIFGQTPLHLASFKWKFVSENRYLAIISALAEHRANIAITDQYGNTPLHYAAYSPQLYKRGQLLLELKAPINAQNREGYTALHLAAHTLNDPLVQVLLGNGADTLICDKNGHIPLDLAAHQRRPSNRGIKIKIMNLLSDHKSKKSDK